MRITILALDVRVADALGGCSQKHDTKENASAETEGAIHNENPLATNVLGRNSYLVCSERDPQ